jgi:hypothetical protein
MAKLIVEIDIGKMVLTFGDQPDSSKETLLAHMKKYKDDWFPTSDKTLVSVDSGSLTLDPTDDSFYQFKLREVIDSE